MYSICKSLCSVVLFSSVFSHSAWAQYQDTSGSAEYRVNYWISLPVIGVGAVTNSIGLARTRDKEWLTPEQLSGLDKSDVPKFDRIALRQHADAYNKYEESSDFAITWGTLIPAALIIADKRMRKDWLDITFVYLESQILTSNFYGWSFLGPTFIERYRPVTYFPEVPLEERIWGGNRNSFYSGHVSVTAVTTFFMAQSFLDYHPEKRHIKWLYYGLASVPPAVIGYKRVQALKHFPSDVIVGFGIGIAGGVLIPKLHYPKKNKGVSLSLAYEPDWKVVRCVWSL
ncbi:MAG TPA: phosphatase PAP2 family protein [Saprospiraceae bacterium]|nr:phosphatase PAP2 family protein [Saprospiraceae bacterium]